MYDSRLLVEVEVFGKKKRTPSAILLELFAFGDFMLHEHLQRVWAEELLKYGPYSTDICPPKIIADTFLLGSTRMTASNTEYYESAQYDMRFAENLAKFYGTQLTKITSAFHLNFVASIDFNPDPPNDATDAIRAIFKKKIRKLNKRRQKLREIIEVSKAAQVFDIRHATMIDTLIIHPASAVDLLKHYVGDGVADTVKRRFVEEQLLFTNVYATGFFHPAICAEIQSWVLLRPHELADYISAFEDAQTTPFFTSIYDTMCTYTLSHADVLRNVRDASFSFKYNGVDFTPSILTDVVLSDTRLNESCIYYDTRTTYTPYACIGFVASHSQQAAEALAHEWEQALGTTNPDIFGVHLPPCIVADCQMIVEMHRHHHFSLLTDVQRKRSQLWQTVYKAQYDRLVAVNAQMTARFVPTQLQLFQPSEEDDHSDLEHYADHYRLQTRNMPLQRRLSTIYNSESFSPDTTPRYIPPPQDLESHPEEDQQDDVDSTQEDDNTAINRQCDMYLDAMAQTNVSSPPSAPLPADVGPHSAIPPDSRGSSNDDEADDVPSHQPTQGHRRRHRTPKPFAPSTGIDPEEYPSAQMPKRRSYKSDSKLRNTTLLRFTDVHDIVSETKTSTNTGGWTMKGVEIALDPNGSPAFSDVPLFPCVYATVLANASGYLTDTKFVREEISTWVLKWFNAETVKLFYPPLPYVFMEYIQWLTVTQPDDSPKINPRDIWGDLLVRAQQLEKAQTETVDEKR
jgi:hypothetical protein